jgi:hypothetical protein
MTRDEKAGPERTQKGNAERKLTVKAGLSRINPRILN